MTGEASPFWNFSLGFYRRPSVSEACIALQDSSGVDVNLLLFLLWQASLGRRLSEDEVRALAAQVEPWGADVIAPLRALRRRMKDAPPSPVSAAASEAFRTRIKTLELEGERLHQEAMYRIAQAAPMGVAAATGDAARANIAACARVMLCQFPDGAVQALLRAMDGETK